MDRNLIEKAGQFLSADTDENIERMINLIANHENENDLIEMVDDDVNVWQPLEFSLTCKEFLDGIGYTKN